MIRNLLLTLGIILLTSVVMYAQEGTLKGKLVDKDTKEPIPFARLMIVPETDMCVECADKMS